MPCRKGIDGAEFNLNLHVKPSDIKQLGPANPGISCYCCDGLHRCSESKHEDPFLFQLPPPNSVESFASSYAQLAGFLHRVEQSTRLQSTLIISIPVWIFHS